MNKLLFLAVLISFTFINNTESACSKQSSRPIKTYKIDLDKPPSKRFVEPLVDFKEQIFAVVDAQKKALKINGDLLKIFELIAADLDNYFPYPFNEELRGGAAAIGMNLGDAVIANLLYDLTAFCTGIIAVKDDGQIIHGRNLDYDFSDYLKNLTYKAEFYRNGKLLFTTVQQAGYIGVLTGHKYKNFTFSLNERDQGEWWINFIYGIFDKSSTPVSFLTREIMENATSFNDAVNKLQKRDLIAPVYFIVAGVNPNEGVVITRNQSHTVDTWRLNSQSKGIEKWYLLETNYDHWKPPPPNDDRRTPGMKAMNQTTQNNINYDTLLDVLTIDPVCNSDTVFTAIMSAADENESINVIIR